MFTCQALKLGKHCSPLNVQAALRLATAACKPRPTIETRLLGHFPQLAATQLCDCPQHTHTHTHTHSLPLSLSFFLPFSPSPSLSIVLPIGMPHIQPLPPFASLL